MDIDKFLDGGGQKDLLRLITCGSVDDGKSTLVGRLLYSSKLVFEDQLQVLRADSERIGTTKGTGEIDYALLLDGLKAEREQGITIDVAYRYFATPRREFIIADTPGHEQYTRNMATGASTASLALILVDARKGMLTQTRRHSFIVSLLGIRHVVVAINKMDLADYSQETFLNIKREFEEFSGRLDFLDVTYIPLAALKGDNVVERSDKMPWYDGPPLLEHLESVDAKAHRNFNDFRFPVQYVNRPNLDFRGFAGTVVSGVVHKGDRVKVLPSLKESAVKEIVTADGNLDKAFPPMAVTLTLEDEIDISRGDMLVHANNIPCVAKNFEALVVWMGESNLEPGATYVLRQAGGNRKAMVNHILYSIDVNTLDKRNIAVIGLNGIGRVAISTTTPLFYDAYSKNRETGSFVLIDPKSNNTVGAGMIVDGHSHREPLKDTETAAGLMGHIGNREFFWDPGYVVAQERAARNRHRGKTVIITGGLGGAGLELAKSLERELFQKNMNSYYLGLSSVTGGLDADLDDGFAARDEHLRRLGELSKIMADAGLIFISALEDADGVDVERLKALNHPHELLVVNLGRNKRPVEHADVYLDDVKTVTSGTQVILKLLSEHNIIPDYSI